MGRKARQSQTNPSPSSALLGNPVHTLERLLGGGPVNVFDGLLGVVAEGLVNVDLLSDVVGVEGSPEVLLSGEWWFSVEKKSNKIEKCMEFDTIWAFEVIFALSVSFS